METPDVTLPGWLPEVTVIIATRDREELLRQSVAAVVAQDYPGRIDILVVYDQMPPNDRHESTYEGRAVHVTANARTPGLAGARNTGLAAAEGEVVAFCDDDDVWRPDKLRRQVADLGSSGSVASVTGITVHYEGISTPRIPDVDELTTDLLTRSRMTGAHPSSYVMRNDVIDSIGLVDEDLPGGYGEDYDWLIRLTHAGRVSVVRAPLVDVLWHRGSYFTNRWSSIIDGLDYFVDKYPSVAADPRGRARILGQKAFALAALGRPRAALAAAWQAFRFYPLERRAWVSALVCTRLVSADWVMHQANKRGRGI
ncbi:MAG: glycosyltransferase family 2 protein [Nocardioidaceae bacterium]